MASLGMIHGSSRKQVTTMASFFNKLSPLGSFRSSLSGRHTNQAVRPFSAEISHHRHHQETHKFLEPECFIGSWKAPTDPEEAQKRLAQLRRDYAKKVKAVRKEYIHEVEMLRIEKQRKEEARMQAMRVANEERRRLKVEAAKLRAEERKIAEEEFRKTLMKERAEKLENWRMKERAREENKKEKQELLRRQSSLWVEHNELEKKILEAIVDVSSL
ncbi:PREDICTED: golgin subfamily A member 6-like protein 22 [Tarenaya hassleriana]|uniref:golgin subfamily A member 6-like protein 22 n=1 Tax=Tarenaya hassleriana TaxID=28532 RepID=UPI00053C47A4|nr:PREDICTED: golgin subfamily A member 6-like protein 22 [Tarenaya hassleriana]